MLLIECQVNGFGGISNYSCQFTDGMNIVCEENGWGKSTLAAFIGVMLYGLSGNNKKDLENSERKKYKPWNGGAYGGSLVFEAKGKTYRVERGFGAKESEDTFRLTDLATNLDSTDYSSKLGLELFGLDKEAYAASTFIPQNHVRDAKGNESLLNKLGKTDDSVAGQDFERACKRLEELRKKYVPDRNANDKGLVAEQKKRVLTAEQAKRSRNHLSAEKKELEKEAITLETTCSYLSLCRDEAVAEEQYSEARQGLVTGEIEAEKRSELTEQMNQYRVLLGSTQSLRLSAEEQAELDRLETAFASGLPDEEECGRYYERDKRVRKNQEEVDEELKQSEERLLGWKKKHKNLRLLTLLCVVLGIAFLGLWMFFGRAGKSNENETTATKRKTDGAICAVLAVASLCGGIGVGVLYKNAGKSEAEAVSEREASKVQKLENEKQNEEITAWYGRFQIVGDTAEERWFSLKNKREEYDRLAQREEKYREADKMREQTIAPIRKLLEQNNIHGPYEEGLRELEARNQRILQAKEEWMECQTARIEAEGNDGLSKEEIQSTGAALKNRDASAISKRLEERTARFHANRRRLEEVNRELVLTEEAAEALESEKDQLAKLTLEHALVKKTILCMQSAKEQFGNRYRAKLEQAFLMYWKTLRGGAATGQEEFYLDANLNLHMRICGEEKDLAFLSAGLRDLVFFCMRLAMVEALFTEERPFLVIDDTFVNLDEEKLGHVLKLLKGGAVHCQLLYFSCHRSRI